MDAKEICGEVLRAIKYDPGSGKFHWLYRGDRPNRWNTRWAGKEAGTVRATGYRAIGVLGRIVLAHRLAWLVSYGCWPTGEIDHINGDKDDNRISNLRDVGRRENNQNRLRANKNSKSGLLGVSWSKKAKKWAAQIRPPGETHRHLGEYDCPHEAHAAYLKEKRKIHPGSTI